MPFIHIAFIDFKTTPITTVTSLSHVTCSIHSKSPTFINNEGCQPCKVEVWIPPWKLNMLHPEKTAPPAKKNSLFFPFPSHHLWGKRIFLQPSVLVPCKNRGTVPGRTFRLGKVWWWDKTAF